MIGSTVLTTENILLAGYVCFGSILNIAALFIASFYKHSLHQSSPQVGFISAVIFSFIYIGLLFFGSAESAGIKISCFISLIGYGVSSSYSILMLFINMRSNRR
jgi:hypothetical protein